MKKHRGFGYAAAARAFLYSAKVAALCLILVFGCRALLPAQCPPIPAVIAGRAAAMVGWLEGVVLFRSPIAEEIPGTPGGLLPPPCRAP
jgi:hypothetical protein